MIADFGAAVSAILSPVLAVLDTKWYQATNESKYAPDSATEVGP